jgi:hypothetical protein
MNKKLLTIFLLSFSCFKLFAQTSEDSIRNVIANYYKLALQYKDGNGVTMNYAKAYNYFSKAANLGDAQSIYAVGYMQYKGLGCTQDYIKAASLFAKGSKLGRDNSMYFYGLCWRNGYGVDKNEDSAKYWLNKAAASGYKQAVQELKMTVGENANDSANALVQQINNAAIPDKRVLNQYTKIQHYLPASEIIAGDYKGYLIQYDWSGTHIISSKDLKLSLVNDQNILSGSWIESGDSVNISASLTSDSIIFNKMQYGRKDHYSPDKAIQYIFQNARLNLVQKEDSVFLAGNVEMFSTQRGEPSKPLFIALSRTDTSLIAKKLQIKTYPNPFTDVLIAEFEIPKTKDVVIQFLNLNGTVMYHNAAGKLEPGHYSLPVQIGRVSAGTYLLKFIYGNYSKTVKVIKTK